MAPAGTACTEGQQALVGRRPPLPQVARGATARSGCRSWPGDLRAASPLGIASLSAIGPITASISSRVAPPGRSRVGVGGREIEHRRFDADEAGPAIEDHRRARAERLRDMLGAGRAHLAAAIGRGRRDRPAGRRASAPGPSGWDGARIATVSRPAVASRAMVEPSARGSTSVSGPGQKRAASFSAVSLQRTKARAAAASRTWLISGLNCGRPLASKIAATARSLVASPPSP